MARNRCLEHHRRAAVREPTAASGQSEQGMGVAPDIALPSTDDGKMTPIGELDPGRDPALATAIELLRE